MILSNNIDKMWIVIFYSVIMYCVWRVTSYTWVAIELISAFSWGKGIFHFMVGKPGNSKVKWKKIIYKNEWRKKWKIFGCKIFSFFFFSSFFLPFFFHCLMSCWNWYPHPYYFCCYVSSEVWFSLFEG